MERGSIPFNLCSLAFDGIQILKRNYDDNILIELKNEIKEKMGFDLNFTKKKMDEDYLEEIQNIDDMDEQTETNIDIILH